MKREIWKKLEEWKGKKDRKPLILKGARQVGKTYILKAFGKESFPKFHYANFEKDKQLAKIFEKDLNPKRIIQELSFYLNTTIDIQNDFIIFDEIQNIPRALTSLKYFQEEIPSLAICAAGSLLGIQLCNESFPVGKVEFLNVFPMSFEEFLLGIKDVKSYDFLHDYNIEKPIPDIIHEHLWNQLKIYFIVGGLPEIVKTYRENITDFFAAIKKVREKQSNLILTYNADMAKHSGKENSMQIERLWQNIPAQLAKEQDGSAHKFKFKGVIPGIHGYSKLAGSIDWLISAGLIIKVHIINSGLLPFSAYAKENSFKLYLFDIGLLGALSDLPPKTIIDYNYGTYKGYFAENFIAQEFICSDIKNLYSWRGRTSEVEFLREHNGIVLPIEIKSGWITQAKSLKLFADKYKSKYKTIMSANKLFIDKVNNIHHYPLYLASKFPLV